MSIFDSLSKCALSFYPGFIKGCFARRSGMTLPPRAGEPSFRLPAYTHRVKPVGWVIVPAKIRSIGAFTIFYTSEACQRQSSRIIWNRVRRVTAPAAI